MISMAQIHIWSNKKRLGFSQNIPNKRFQNRQNVTLQAAQINAGRWASEKTKLGALCSRI